MISFNVHGVPKGQPRARSTIRGKHAGVYDPGTADGWKFAVATAARPHVPAQPLEGPLSMTLDLYLPRPARLCRKKDTPAAVPCDSKPDLDNAVKAVMDALTAVGMWKDDAQVADLRVTKQYHPKGGAPGASVWIWRILEARAAS